MTAATIRSTERCGNDRFQGFAGNDTINGDLGFDRAIYTDATAGIAFNLASGTVTGAGVGTDTLTGIEGIIGTNFADTYDATGFAGSAGIAGHTDRLQRIRGHGRRRHHHRTHQRQGAALTRVSYLDATAGVTVNLATRVADGDASVGHDTFTNTISNVLGSNFADTLTGSNNPGGTVEVFEGRGGNDIINGGGGFDRADYINDLTETTGITVNLAAGTVTGSSVAGNDTLRSDRGSPRNGLCRHYDAAGFGGTSTNAGSLGTFNEFTGGGGNDTIVGNGATRLSYNNATAGVTVDIALGTDRRRRLRRTRHVHRRQRRPGLDVRRHAARRRQQQHLRRACRQRPHRRPWRLRHRHLQQHLLRPPAASPSTWRRAR